MSDAARPLVLVVEDDRDTREMYALFLDLSGLEVLTASTADAAFDLALTRQPQVVVTDLLLPGGATGADLCRRLHEDGRTSHIRSVLLTGATHGGEMERAQQACAAVRIKPHTPEALLSDIREILERGGPHPG